MRASVLILLLASCVADGLPEECKLHPDGYDPAEFDKAFVDCENCVRNWYDWVDALGVSDECADVIDDLNIDFVEPPSDQCDGARQTGVAIWRYNLIRIARREAGVNTVVHEAAHFAYWCMGIPTDEHHKRMAEGGLY